VRGDLKGVAPWDGGDLREFHEAGLGHGMVR